MAGGEGTRLRPLTCTCPKPMVNFLGKPMLEHIIDLLKKHNITDIYMTLMYMPEIIKDYFGDGSKFSVNIEYFIEESPLGTAGSVYNTGIDEEFLVISGDCLTDCNLTELIAFHNQKNAVATINLSKSSEPLEYGVVVKDSEDRITRLLEKPDWSEVISDNINTGIYVLSPEVFQGFENKGNFDFSKDVFPKLIEESKGVYAYEDNGYWCDIGDLKTYREATVDVLQGKIKLKLNNSNNIQIGQNVYIEEPVFIGNNVAIHDGAKISKYCVIEDNAEILGNASIKESYIHKNVKIGKKAQLRRSIVAEGVTLGQNVSCFEGSVVGDSSVVGASSELYSNIKIWPKKQIENNTIVSSNLVFGSNISHNLFQNGATDTLVTPEYASKLGSVFGALFPQGKVGIAYGSGYATLMLKDAIISGLLSAGVEAYDLSVGTLATLRSAVSYFNLDGGIYISYNNDKLELKFLSDRGVNLSRNEERKLEQLFSREDYARVEPAKMKNIVRFQDFNRFYMQDLVNFIGDDSLMHRVSVISNSVETVNIAKTVLQDVGVKVLEKKELGYIAFFLDDIGEEVIVHDEKGRKVANEVIWSLFTAILLFNNIKKIVIPITLPNFIREDIIKNEASIIESKDSVTAVLFNCIKNGLTIQKRLLTDPNYAILSILKFLEKNNIMLSDFVDSLPKSYIAKKEVEIRPEKKAEVMRIISEAFDDMSYKTDTNSGFKVKSGDAWACLIPHKTEGKINIVSEGITQEFADELADVCYRTITET